MLLVEISERIGLPSNRIPVEKHLGYPDKPGILKSQI